MLLTNHRLSPTQPRKCLNTRLPKDWRSHLCQTQLNRPSAHIISGGSNHLKHIVDDYPHGADSTLQTHLSMSRLSSGLSRNKAVVSNCQSCGSVSSNLWWCRGPQSLRTQTMRLQRWPALLSHNWSHVDLCQLFVVLRVHSCTPHETSRAAASLA